MDLTTAQLDRACGVLLATAAGDALGAGYEFGPPLARTPRTAGNGSLMRTAPVALAFLDDPDGLTQAATALSALTHYDPEAGEACALWCHAIRHAVLTGRLDARVGLEWLPESSRDGWAGRLNKAERARTRDFTRNGWVVEALQAAWCAIATTGIPEDDPPAGEFRAGHLRLALEQAVRGGRDADTVAAIAGGLLGAAYGASAVPARWRLELHGWPGLKSRDLIALGAAIATPATIARPVYGDGQCPQAGTLGP